jgi:hypothetical protein
MNHHKFFSSDAKAEACKDVMVVAKVKKKATGSTGSTGAATLNDRLGLQNGPEKSTQIHIFFVPRMAPRFFGKPLLTPIESTHRDTAGRRA